MKTLSPEPLTALAFQPYGDVIETTGASSTSINSGNCLRYSDLVSLNIDRSGITGISLFDAKPYTMPIQLDYVERHPLGSQAFIPMLSAKYLVIVADDIDGVAQEPKVFIANETQGVNYKRNTWHGILTPLIKRNAERYAERYAERNLFAVVDYIGDKDNLEESVYKTPYLIDGGW